jgi:hypothetical protein
LTCFDHRRQRWQQQQPLLVAVGHYCVVHPLSGHQKGAGCGDWISLINQAFLCKSEEKAADQLSLTSKDFASKK